jgi:hypothetical protein
MREQIGTVTVTRDRVYNLDPQTPGCVAGTQVIVEPGQYPVYRDALSTYWRMTGVIGHGHYRMGDGMWAMNSGDVRSEDDVVFYSQRYGPDEFAGLVRDFEAMADPALVFTIDVNA